MTLEIDRNTQRFVRSFIDIIILALLKNGPKWGYEIMTAIRRQYSVKLSPGTLYPLLYVLEENGYLKGEWKAHKKKKKRTYMITEDGKKFVRENIQALEKILNTIEKGSKNLPSK